MREAKANKRVTYRTGGQLREPGGSECQGSGVRDAGRMG